MNYNLSKKEYDILLYLRKKPRKMKRIMKKFNKDGDDAFNIRLSDLRNLFYTMPEGSKVLEADSLHLNDIGETVAQAEFDRRFDMYFTRVMALLALAASIFALIFEAA